MRIRLYYIITDGQDGSASIHLFKSQYEAEQASEKEEQEYGMPPLDEGNVVIDPDDYEVVG